MGRGEGERDEEKEMGRGVEMGVGIMRGYRGKENKERVKERARGRE